MQWSAAVVREKHDQEKFLLLMVAAGGIIVVRREKSTFEPRRRPILWSLSRRVVAAWLSLSKHWNRSLWSSNNKSVLLLLGLSNSTTRHKRFWRKEVLRWRGWSAGSGRLRYLFNHAAADPKPLLPSSGAPRCKYDLIGQPGQTWASIHRSSQRTLRLWAVLAVPQLTTAVIAVIYYAFHSASIRFSELK